MDTERDRGRRWRPATRLVRGGAVRSPFGETSEALFLTSGFCYANAAEAAARFRGEAEGFVYSRYSNPTVRMFLDRLAALEEAEAASATASGMAAVSAALLAQVKAGDHVVAARALFGSCRYVLDELLPRFGVAVSLVDGTDLAQWRAALRPGTVCAFVETPANPTLELVDLRAVADLCHAVGARLIVDNVFATPLLQRPIRLGADIVVYSATKHIDGHGRCLGGAILGDAAFCEGILSPFLRHTGPSLSPFNAWVLLKGLETLAVRLDRQVRSSTELARFLCGLDGLRRVLYPGLADHPQHELATRQMSGFGTVVAFEIDGGQARAFRFLDGLRLIDISNNLGDAKSLITHPLSTTHQRLGAEECARLGIGAGLVRLSVGLEDVEDLKEDLQQALAAA
ncbi:MAG: O-succinylhomoserine sulfhydrylase [Alphaproteobacteria bacterium]|nr:O-succinylhomoserine sulfhydrylase [Alphaproteobacteria bacterium]